MGKRLFGSIEFYQCVVDLGCKVDRCSSSHILFNLPLNHKLPLGERPYITIQMGKKQFDKHECNRYITQLVRKGFDRAKILELLKC